MCKFCMPSPHKLTGGSIGSARTELKLIKQNSFVAKKQAFHPAPPLSSQRRASMWAQASNRLDTARWSSAWITLKATGFLVIMAYHGGVWRLYLLHPLHKWQQRLQMRSNEIKVSIAFTTLSRNIINGWFDACYFLKLGHAKIISITLLR